MDMNEKQMCQRCLLPITYTAHGWRHMPGPGRTVPDPGHAVVPIPRDRLTDAIREGTRDG